MGSGKLNKNNDLCLKSDSFNILDLVKLINIIKIKYDINCTLITKKNSSLIGISNKEIKRLFSILDPYFYDFYKNTNQIQLFKESPSRLKVFNQVRHFHLLSPRFRFSNLERNSFILPQNLKEILIGLLLGDLYIQNFTKNENTNLQFEQGLVHKDYIYHLYDLFKDYCIAEPKISDRKPDYRTNKIYTRIRFHTYVLPCFNEFYLLFYPDGKKNIPQNIGELLTPLSLAFWAMDDGNKKSNNNFIFNTNSYTLKEVELLSSVLKEKFNLDCSIQRHNKNKEQFRIYIKSKSIVHFKNLVSPYFHESMLYKLDFFKQS